MNISVWLKYKIISVSSAIIIMCIFFFVCTYFSGMHGFLLSIGLHSIRAIYLHSIKCPKCNYPIDNRATIFSANKDGWFAPMKKTCCNCGYDLTQKEKRL